MYVIEKEIMLQTMLKMQLNETSHRGLTHIAQYDPEYVFKLISEECESTDLPKHLVHGFNVKRGSQRYQVFKKSCKCVACGVVGTVMCLDTSLRDKHSNRAHFNLYGIAPSGRVVMLTKDHIVPKASGGEDTLDNYQTMCASCNEKKGDK